MCSRTVLNELKNLQSQKKDSVQTLSAPRTTLLQSLPYHFVCCCRASFAELEQKLQLTGLPW